MRIKHLSLYLFIITEIFIFSTFYAIYAFSPLSPYPRFFDLLYLAVVPILLMVTIASDPDLRKIAFQWMGHYDWVFLVAAIFIWGYLFAYFGFSPLDLFYEIAFIDEINFRFLMYNVLCRYVSREKAVIIQGLLFALLYMSYYIFRPGAYPGIYGPLFVIDMVLMGLLYGFIVYFRKNLYLDLLLHLSLFDAIYFSPPIPGWIPYLMLPS